MSQFAKAVLGYCAMVGIVLGLVGVWAALAPKAKAQTGFAENPYLFSIDRGTKTATAVAGAVTLAKQSGVITSESLVTAAGATYTLTITNTGIAAADMVFASVWLGTATTGTPTIATVKPLAGSVVIVVQNIHASAALNGTLKIAFMNLKTQ